jgi:uncharacterized membrane protein YkvA (DUF1232 family)
MAIRCQRCNSTNSTLSRYCQNCAVPLAPDLYAIDSLNHAESATGSKIILFLCILYLLNITFGLDIIPDNFPVVGNLDEAGAVILAVKSWMKIQDIKAASRAKEIKIAHSSTSHRTSGAT